MNISAMAEIYFSRYSHVTHALEDIHDNEIPLQNNLQLTKRYIR